MGRKQERSGPIGGFSYSVRQLSATEGLSILTALTKLLLPSIGELTKGIGGSSVDLKNLMAAEVGADVLSGAASHLARDLNSNTVQQIVSAFRDSTEIYGPGFGDAGAPMDVHFDEHFAGRYGEMIEWLTFALKLNYGNFLQGLGIGGGTESAPQQPQSPE